MVYTLTTDNMSPGQGSYCLGFGAGHREVRLQLDVYSLVSEHWSLTARKCTHSRSKRETVMTGRDFLFP